MKKALKFSVYTIITISLIISISAFQFHHFLHRSLQVGEKGYVLVVSSGTSVYKMVKQLYNDKVLQSPIWFLIWLRAEGNWNKLKAGEYLIKPKTLPAEFVEQLCKGRVIQHALTIVPGWNFEQLMIAINQFPQLTHTLAGFNAAEIMVKLGHPGEHPEGRFFPETYYFPAGTTDIAFLERAYNLLQTKLDYWWSKRSGTLPLKSSYEALVLASIIEKESGFIDEYREIAGVYIRRLQRLMPLQADPTVIYGLGRDFVGGLTRVLLKNPTPYNTYQNVGLPPTPIALPSEKAIEAAVNPKSGDTLYFVAKPDGNGHAFSKSLKEHQIAVIEYRKALLGNK